MTKKIMIFVLIAFSLLILSCLKPSPKVCFEKKCINVEIADSESERQQGLMFREALDENSGMIFMHEKDGIYKYWMKNTLIPLDMIWLDGNKKIIYIQKNAVPCKADPCPTYGPDFSSRYVIEANSGFVEENNIDVNESVEFFLN